MSFPFKHSLWFSVFSVLMPDISPSLTLTPFNYIIQNLSEMNVFQILKTYGLSSFFKFAEALACWFWDLNTWVLQKVFSPLCTSIVLRSSLWQIFLMSNYINFDSFNKVFSFWMEQKLQSWGAACYSPLNPQNLSTVCWTINAQHTKSKQTIDVKWIAVFICRASFGSVTITLQT